MKNSLKVSSLIALEMIKVSSEDSVQLCMLFPQKHFVVMDTSKINQSLTLITNDLLVPLCRLTKEEAELLQDDQRLDNASKVIKFYVDMILPAPEKNTLEFLINHVNQIISE